MNVLLVEDEVNARDVYCRLLELDGHAVVTADGARSAMSAIDRHEFQAALIDLGLGADSGFRVLEYLKRRQPGVRAVVMTAYDGPDAAGRLEARDADAFLTKPLRWSEAQTALRPAQPEPSPGQESRSR